MTKLTIPTTQANVPYEALKNPDLPIGTVASIHLHNGKTADFILAEKNVYGATNVFVNADGNAFGELPMYEYENIKRPVCYAESDRVKQLKKMLELFPDELRDMMIEREIKQIVKGKSSSVTAKLWTPSTTEIFGEGKNPCDVDDVHFSFFNSEKSRIIESDERGTWFYALRSPTPSRSDSFGNCYISGGYNPGLASDAYCVRCGFLL